MIKNILALSLFIPIIFGIIVAPRVHSKWWLARRMYQHVDTVCGAKAFEKEYAATMRNTWGENRLTRWLWPHPELAGAMARPHWWRRRLYVQLGYQAKPWPMPYFKRDIVLVTITYTSEADHNDKTLFPKIESAAARGLSQPWHEDLFEHDRRSYPYTGGLTDHRPERDQVSLLVAEPLVLPRRVSAAEALNGRVDTLPDAQDAQLAKGDANMGQ